MLVLRSTGAGRKAHRHIPTREMFTQSHALVDAQCSVDNDEQCVTVGPDGNSHKVVRSADFGEYFLHFKDLPVLRDRHVDRFIKSVGR
jgi:hypothetical protein